MELAALAAERPYHRVVVALGRPWWAPVHLARAILRFSSQARRVLGQADREAARLGQHHLGTEHILLGMLRDRDNAGARALQLLGIAPERLGRQVEEIAGDNWSGPPTFGPIPPTPRATKVLRLARREALRLGQNYIGSEHLLLGLIAERESLAAQVLVRAGATYRPVRDLLRSDPGGFGSPEDGTLLGILGRRLASIEAQLARPGAAESASRPWPSDPDRGAAEGAGDELPPDPTGGKPGPVS